MGTIEGKVVAIDPAGNLITDIAAERLRGLPTDERVSISCDEHETRGLYPPEHGQPAMTLLGVVDPAGALMLTIVDDSAALMLGIRVGEKVVVRW